MLRTTTKFARALNGFASEFSIFLLPVYDPQVRGKQIGHKLSITLFRWSDDGGLKWRVPIMEIEWDIPYRTEGEFSYGWFLRAKRLKRIVRRALRQTGRVPDMHAIAMRLR